jgi:hypothetical protein
MPIFQPRVVAMTVFAPYPKVKLSIVALLSINAVLFLFLDTWLAALDAFAWLLLLISYEIEAYSIDLPINSAYLTLFRRAIIALLPIPVLGYILLGQGMETVNSMIWFVLIGVIEFKVGWPDYAIVYQNSLWGAQILLFLGLIAMAVLWAWMGDWLSAYDASLWIIAFAIIEADIAHFFKLPDADAL